MTKIKIDWKKFSFATVLAVFIFTTCLFIPGFIEVQKKKELPKTQADINKYISGPYDKLETACRKMLKIAPEDCFRWAPLGEALFFQGKYKEATEVIEKVMELDPEGLNVVTWEVQFHLAWSYYELGQKEKGDQVICRLKEYIKKGVILEGKDYTPVLMGMLIYTVGKYDLEK